jgi:hypothetical protein
MSTGEKPEDPARRSRGRFAVPAVFGVIIMVLGVVWLGLRVLGSSAAPGAPVTVIQTFSGQAASGGMYIACAWAPAAPRAASASAPDGLVPRPAATRVGVGVMPSGCPRGITQGGAPSDLARRAPLTNAERSVGQSVAYQVFHVIGALGYVRPSLICATGSPGMRCRPSSIRATAAEVVPATRALQAAGYRDVAVRMARPNDPARPGALVYAVAIGPACVVGGWGGSSDTGGEFQFVAGRLPGETCLAP